MFEKLGFEKLERVLAPLAGLLVFALNDMRLLQQRPRTSEPAAGLVHAFSPRILDAQEVIFISGGDMALRWALFAMIVALGLWALSETFPARNRAGT